MTPGAPTRWRVRPLGSDRVFYCYAPTAAEARKRVATIYRGRLMVRRADHRDGASAMEGDLVPR